MTNIESKENIAEESKSQIFKISEVSEMTEIPVKKIERWVTEKKEGSGYEKNQGLFDLKYSKKGKISNEGVRVFTSEEIKKLLIVMLRLSYNKDMDYSKIKTELNGKDYDFANTSKKIYSEIIKRFDIDLFTANRIESILKEQDELEQVNNILGLVKFINLTSDGNPQTTETEKYLRSLPDIISEYQYRANEKISETEYSRAVAEFNIILDRIIGKRIYAKTIIVNINKAPGQNVPWDKIRKNNDLLVDILISADGELLHEIWEKCVIIDKAGFVTANFKHTLTHLVKSILNIPYLSCYEDVNGYYLTHQLYKNKDYYNVKRLISLGKTDINFIDEDNLTLLDYASEEQNTEMVKYLLNHNAAITNDTIYKICLTKDIPFLEIVINYIPEPAIKFFLHSILTGDFKSIEYLIGSKFEVVYENFIKKYISRSERFSEGNWTYPSLEFIYLISSQTDQKYNIIDCLSEKLNKEYREHILKILVKHEEMTYFSEYLKKFVPDSNTDMTDLFDYYIDYERDPLLLESLINRYEVKLNDYFPSLKSKYMFNHMNYDNSGYLTNKLLSWELSTNPEYTEKVIDLILPRTDKEKYKSENCINLLASVYDISEKNNDLNDIYVSIIKKFINHFFDGDTVRVLDIYIDAILRSVKVDPPMTRNELIEYVHINEMRISPEIKFAEKLKEMLK